MKRIIRKLFGSKRKNSMQVISEVNESLSDTVNEFLKSSKQ